MKIAFILFRVDIIRFYRRLLAELPHSLQKRLESYCTRTILASVLALVGCAGLIIFLVAAIVFEVMRLTATEIDDFVYLASIILLILFLGEARSSAKSLERATHPEDFDVLYRSPINPAILVMTRFMRFAVVRALLWFFFLGITVIALTWISPVSPGILIVYFFLGLPFIGLTLCVLCICGIVSYQLSKISLFVLGTSVIHTLFVLFVVGSGMAFMTWSIIRFQQVIDSTFAIFQDVFNLTQLLSIVQSPWLPSNWFIFALQAGGQGYFGEALVWTGLTYSVIIPVLLALCWLTIRLAPMRPSLENKANLPVNNMVVTACIERATKWFSKHIHFLIAKEIKGILRADPLVRRQLVGMLLLQTVVIGFAVGLGWAGVYNASTWQVLFPVFITLYTLCSFFGSALLPITSMDAEGSLIVHYLKAPGILTHLFVAKALVQTAALFLLGFGLLIAMYIVFRFSILVMVTSMALLSATAVVVGFAQIGGSAFFPRFDWEHHFEVGQSPRASLIAEACNWIFFVGTLQILVITAFFHTSQRIKEPVMLLIIGLSVLMLSIIFAVTLRYIFQQRGTRHWEMV